MASLFFNFTSHCSSLHIDLSELQVKKAHANRQKKKKNTNRRNTISLTNKQTKTQTNTVTCCTFRERQQNKNETTEVVAHTGHTHCVFEVVGCTQYAIFPLRHRGNNWPFPGSEWLILDKVQACGVVIDKVWGNIKITQLEEGQGGQTLCHYSRKCWSVSTQMIFEVFINQSQGSEMKQTIISYNLLPILQAVVFLQLHIYHFFLFLLWINCF